MFKRKKVVKRTKPKVSLAFKIKSSSSYAGELGISQERAWRRLWPEDFKKRRAT